MLQCIGVDVYTYRIAMYLIYPMPRPCTLYTNIHWHSLLWSPMLHRVTQWMCTSNPRNWWKVPVDSPHLPALLRKWMISTQQDTSKNNHDKILWLTEDSKSLYHFAYVRNTDIGNYVGRERSHYCRCHCNLSMFHTLFSRLQHCTHTTHSGMHSTLACPLAHTHTS